jgi:predicted ATPase
MTFLTNILAKQCCAKLGITGVEVRSVPASNSILPIQSFQNFGDLLKYLRTRARLTQRELSIAVGYSEAQISRLEQNLRPPDLAALMALFIPALYLEDEPAVVARLMELAAQARGETLPQSGRISLSRSVRREITETIQIVEDQIPGNLPLQLTSFIGRAREIAEIRNFLDLSSEGVRTNRLITLTGSGGSGKTRLALEIAGQLAQRYRDGAWFIELASISDAGLVLQAVNSTLDLPESRDGAPIDTFTKYLRTKHILLIFDNCEQVISGAAQLMEEILQACPYVQIIATSREILNIPGEVRFRVPPLSLPDGESISSHIVSQSESVRLFVERAQAVLRSFALNEDNLSSVIQICRQLDGMPLAIELAAARTATLSIQQIAVRLEDSFRVLSGGRTTLPRHQTLEATIEWSYNLLSEAERALMGRLSIFSGGWTLEAAEAVVSDSALVTTAKVFDLLSQLVNKSLVIVEWQASAEARYTMLQTIHRFAREKLRPRNELEQLRASHFDYFFTLVQQGESSLFVNESWIDLIEAEIDNLRAALTWALETGTAGSPSEERTRKGLELMAHVWPLWLYRGYLSEGNEWMNQFLAAHTTSSPARARALLLAADFARYRGDHTGQVTFIQESLASARKLGDKKRIAWSLMETGLMESDLGHYPQAILLLEEARAMFQELKATLWVYRIYYLMAEIHIADGKLEIARSLWEQGLDLCREENDKWHIGWGLEGLGNVERLEEHLEQSRQLYTESLNLRVSVMDKAGITYLLEAFAQLAAAQKQFQRAAVLWGAAEQLRQTLNTLRIPSKEILYTSRLPAIRAEMGEKLFREAWAEGRAMKMQQAIEYALG